MAWGFSGRCHPPMVEARTPWSSDVSTHWPRPVWWRARSAALTPVVARKAAPRLGQLDRGYSGPSRSGPSAQPGGMSRSSSSTGRSHSRPMVVPTRPRCSQCSPVRRRDEGVDGGPVALGQVAAVGGDGAQDQAGVAGSEGVPVEAEAGGDARGEAVDHDVGAVDERVQSFPVGGVVDVEGDAALAPVPDPRAAERPGGVSAGRLDLHDVGAVVGQQHGGHRSGDAGGQIDDPGPPQWSGHGLVVARPKDLWQSTMACWTGVPFWPGDQSPHAAGYSSTKECSPEPASTCLRILPLGLRGRASLRMSMRTGTL